MLGYDKMTALEEASGQAKQLPDPQITIQNLIRHLSVYNDERLVGTDIDPRTGIGGVSSYRGYYADLALEPEKYVDNTVADVVSMLEDAIGGVYEGYKGGQYRMGKRTVVWLSEWGMASGIKVSGVTAPRYGTGRVILLTSVEQC